MIGVHKISLVNDRPLIGEQSHTEVHFYTKSLRLNYGITSCESTLYCTVGLLVIVGPGQIHLLVYRVSMHLLAMYHVMC